MKRPRANASSICSRRIRRSAAYWKRPTEKLPWRSSDARALDLVFLDVQMPELDGLQVIETVGAAAMPLTVFVTAYDQHAIRAFEANALDYLLKPFSDERWEAALAPRQDSP